ncbi:MAG: alpha/beta hydrolase [Chromatiales bacterium]|nr:alpha/beta hydrolase [Chromatiales bacterium]
MPCARLTAFAGLLALFAASGPGAAAEAGGDPEEAVCNAVLEPFAFWLWQRAAGTPHLPAGAPVPGGEAISFTSRDGRVLRGFRLIAAPPRKGFVLVAQGNATLAERLLPHLRALAHAGYDVVVYDYRGYAGSEGKRRLKAIVGDYRELYARLTGEVPGERLLYGMSFGGIVVLNVIGAGAGFDRAVIDSTPSRIAGYGCPKDYDPVRNLPAASAGLLVIQGARDRVVPADDSAELLDAAEARGARAVRLGAVRAPVHGQGSRRLSGASGADRIVSARRRNVSDTP